MQQHMFVPATAYQQLPKAPQQWLIEKLVPFGGLVNVFGKPKTGKSFLALGWAQAIVNGAADWEGYPIHTHGSVAYLQIDTPREEWSQRIGRIDVQGTEAHDLYIADMWQVPQFPVDILDPQQTSLKWLRDQLATIQPVLTIIDTLREVHGGDENDSTVMRNVVANLVSACRPSAIVLLSHARKDGIMSTTGDEDMMDQGRGSSYVAGRMDVIVKVTPKRLMFKGRATGQSSEVITQDLTTGLIRIIPNSATDKVLALIPTLEAQHPDWSKRALAQRLSETCHISLSTAIRRIDAYRAAKPPSHGVQP